jgi:hypothetical protein
VARLRVLLPRECNRGTPPLVRSAPPTRAGLWGLPGPDLGIFTHKKPATSVRCCDHRQRSTSEFESTTGSDSQVPPTGGTSAVSASLGSPATAISQTTNGKAMGAPRGLAVLAGGQTSRSPPGYRRHAAPSPERSSPSVDLSPAVLTAGSSGSAVELRSSIQVSPAAVVRGGQSQACPRSAGRTCGRATWRPSRSPRAPGQVDAYGERSRPRSPTYRLLRA